MIDNRGVFVDWLRAVDELKPQSEQSMDAISRLLGLRLKAVGSATLASGPVRRPAKPQPQAEPVAAPSVPPPPSGKPRRPVESVLTPVNASRNPAPGWLAAARHLEKTDAEHLRPILCLEPLFAARTSRAILSGVLATPSAGGPLDMRRVIEMLSRGESIEQIPRLSIPTLVRGVQLLIDRGESMQPFAADQAALRAALSRVVGIDRTEVLYFDGLPSWGAGTGPKDEWPDYHTPASGTPVVVLSDIGIAQPPGVAGLPGAADWRAFAETLAHAGCPLLALVPYPPARWPPLARNMTIVQWDRATTAAVVRRAVPAGLRVARGT